jgi:hypothetical protein
VIASLLIAVAFAVPLLILGLVALIRGRPEDMPALMYALARGPKRELSLGDRRSSWPLNQFRQGGPGSNRNPYPQVRGRTTTTDRAP